MKKIIVAGKLLAVLLFACFSGTKSSAQINVHVGNLNCGYTVCVSVMNTCLGIECEQDCFTVTANTPQDFVISPACLPLTPVGDVSCYVVHVMFSFAPGDCVINDSPTEFFFNLGQNYSWQSIGPCDCGQVQWLNGGLSIDPI